MLISLKRVTLYASRDKYCQVPLEMPQAMILPQLSKHNREELPETRHLILFTS